MSLIMVGVEKGGVGKSTLTQNMAAIRASLERRVAIFDIDNQATSTKWVVRRGENADLPQIHAERMDPDDATVERFAETLARLAEEYDDVFIDVGGKDTGIFRAALVAADKIVVPLIPSIADLDTVPDLADVLGKFTKRVDIRVVLNQADPKKRMTKAMISEMVAFKETLPLMSKMVANRETYKFATAQGKGVAELTGSFWDAKAANEMKDLYLGVFK
ncbi:partition protein [Caballeronia choica]|jgi:chromosome partitioning protein|uniref:Partition protein n=1 Tax=Caballeronia choica TaxID=326476 RepID=A0A158KN21_9BURK|nr:ParA family protein [Caballeronia choica]SAL82578.1 partition protein [Caballeronia choica]